MDGVIAPFFCLLIWEVRMGAMIYRGCVAFREWSERRKIGPLIALGKTATTAVARVVRAGGNERLKWAVGPESAEGK
jgi:hypothetical protein